MGSFKALTLLVFKEVKLSHESSVVSLSIHHCFIDTVGLNMSRCTMYIGVMEILVDKVRKPACLQLQHQAAPVIDNVCNL